MNNNNQSKSLFLTKLRERKDKNGDTYFIGSLGMTTLMMRRHKTNADEWNISLLEPLKKDNQQNGFHQQSGGGYAGPSFDQSEEIPF